MFQLGSIFGSAYMRAATPLVAQNGFKHTGIFPVNRDVFSEHEFAPATVTDNADAAEVQPSASESQNLTAKTTGSQLPVSETEEFQHLVVTTESQDPAAEPQEPVVVTIYLTSGKCSAFANGTAVYFWKCEL